MTAVPAVLAELAAATEGESLRQRFLLHALMAPATLPQAPPPSPAGLSGHRDRVLRGVQAYRANAHASAARALASACPTVQAMLGEAAFDSLAVAFWHAHPPTRGDLAEWGDALPGWLAAQAELAEWPYLADCARVDWAVHTCERAADAGFDADSLARLGDTDALRLRLELLPGCALIESRWPIASIHAAHRRGDAADADAEFARVRRSIEAMQKTERDGAPAASTGFVGEAVFVVRDGWRAVVWPVAAVERAWLRHLVAGDDLDSCLSAADPAFDLGAWLARAISQRWLKGVAVVGD